MSRYKTAWFCTACQEELTNNERMYSNGRCPKCGVKGKHAHTVVETTERGYTVDLPWWAFLNRKAFRVYVDEKDNR